MASSIKASSKRTSVTAKASSFGVMAANTKVVGTRVNRAASVSISTTINRGAKATGLMDEESAGLMRILMHLLSDLTPHFPSARYETYNCRVIGLQVFLKL